MFRCLKVGLFGGRAARQESLNKMHRLEGGVARKLPFGHFFMFQGDGLSRPDGLTRPADFFDTNRAETLKNDDFEKKNFGNFQKGRVKSTIFSRFCMFQKRG